MDKVVYRSNSRIERIKGPVRRAEIPGKAEPVTFGVHGAIAEYYGVSPDAFPPETTTIDYVIASTGG